MPTYTEDENIYKKRKDDVMDEGQKKLAEKCLTYFRSSWMAKDALGLFEKWDEIDEYWEGDVNQPESDVDPGSNTNIIHPNIEGQVALLVEQNIAVTANPRGPSDEPFAEDVRVILEWVKEQNKLKRKLDVHERRREKFGTGIFRVLFDPEFMDGFGLPTIDYADPTYIFPDPTVTDIYKINEGRFLIEAITKPINYAKLNFDEELADAIEPGFRPGFMEAVYGEDDGQTDTISKDSYIHMLVWRIEKKDGERKLRLIEMSGCGVILYDSFNLKDDEQGIFEKPRYPYFFTPLYYREGTVWAKGDAELLINTQNTIDDLDDQIRMNARLTGNPQRMVDVASGIDPNRLTNEPGLAIPTQDINGSKWETPPTMPNYIIQRRDNALQYEGQRITRFSDQMTGQKQSGVDTATEALALQQAGTSGIAHKKLLLQETLSEVFSYCLDMVKEYYTEEQAFRITEKKGEFTWFRGSDLKQVPHMIPSSDAFLEGFLSNADETMQPPQWMPLEIPNEITGEMEPATKEAVFDIEVTVGAGLPTNKAFQYQMIKEAAAEGAITMEEYRKLLRERFGIPIEEQMPMPQIPPGAPGEAIPGQPSSTEGMGSDIQGMTPGGNPMQPNIMEMV